MLREKEAREQRIDPQQTLPRQGNEILARFLQIAFRIERGELRGEPLQDVHAVLVREVGRAPTCPGSADAPR